MGIKRRLRLAYPVAVSNYGWGTFDQIVTYKLVDYELAFKKYIDFFVE